MAHNVSFTPALQITALNNCLTCNLHHPYYFGGEFHPFWEMVYAIDGTFRVAGNEKVYTMKKGDVIFHKPMEFHRLWSVDGQDIRAYIIGFCATGDLLSQLEGGAFVLSESQQAQLERVMTFAAQQFPPLKKAAMADHLHTMKAQRTQKPVQIQIYTELLQLFLLSLADETTPLAVKDLSDSENSRLFRSIVRLLTEHLQDWVTTEDLARQLHYSPTRIKRTFARYSDIGIHKYLLKLKIAEAIRLLQRGKPCGEVSAFLGFANQNYFSTVFKRETGHAPSLYSQLLPPEQTL